MKKEMKKEIIVYSPFPNNNFPKKVWTNKKVMFGGVLEFIPYNLFSYDEVLELMNLLTCEKLKITIEPFIKKEK